MSIVDSLRKILALPDCMVFAPQPGRLFEEPGKPELEQWLRLTSTVSVPVDHSLPIGDEKRYDEKWARNINAAKQMGATKLVVQWKPWHRFRDEAGTAAVMLASPKTCAREMQFLADRFAALKSAWGGKESVIGLSDSEVFDCRLLDESAAAETLYRKDELLWQAHWGTPNYRYDLGGVRRISGAWEPTKWFPVGYVPQSFGRAAPSLYHLGHAADFLARFDATYNRRAVLFSSATNPPPKYGLFITFGQSSDLGGGKIPTWPRRSTAAMACLLREAVTGHAAWIDRLCVWMTQADYDSEETIRQVEAFSAGWRLFDSPAEATRTVG